MKHNLGLDLPLAALLRIQSETFVSSLHIRCIRPGNQVSFARTSTNRMFRAQTKTDPNRPIFHIAAKRGWINDPNGPFVYQGRTHMYVVPGLPVRPLVAPGLKESGRASSGGWCTRKSMPF
jgi:hypothetical protein